MKNAAILILLGAVLALGAVELNDLPPFPKCASIGGGCGSLGE